MGEGSNEELLLSGYRVSIWEDKVVEMDDGDDCTLSNCKCALKMVLFYVYFMYNKKPLV